MLFSLISFMNSRQLSLIHQKLLNLKNIENVHVKTLNQYCPNVHIFVSYFRSCCSPSRNPILENQLTGFSTYYNNTQTLGITWFNSSYLVSFKLTKTEVLICRYEDADSKRYSYKNILRTYAANLHKRVAADAFPHKFNAFSFHYTTDFFFFFLYI